MYVLRSPTLLAIDKSVIKEVLIKNFKSFHNNEVSYQMDKNSDPLFGRNPFILKDEEWKEKRNQIAPAMTIARVMHIIFFANNLDFNSKLNIFLAKIIIAID